MQILPVLTVPIDIQDPLASATSLSATVDNFLTDGMGVSESHDAILSNDEECCHHLSFPVYSPFIYIIQEHSGNPLTSSKNSWPLDGQLNRSFKF